MAMNFPDSPVDGEQSQQSNGVLYKWNASKTRWEVISTNVNDTSFDLKLAGYNVNGTHVKYDADLNLIDYDSFFHINTSLATNFPIGMTGHGFVRSDVMFEAKDYVTQTMYGANSTSVWKIWMRSMQAGVWGDWKLVIDGGAFSQRLAGLNDDGNHVKYNADVNDIEDNSVYHTSSSVATNLPADMDGHGFIRTDIFEADKAYRTQTIYGNTANNEFKQWMRSMQAGVWGAWKLVVDGERPRIGFINGVTGALSRGNGGVTCVRDSAGVYTLTFDPPFANNLYNVQVTAADTGKVVSVSSGPAPDTQQVFVTDLVGALTDGAFAFSVKSNE